jgi:dienelactone hydrolase
MKLLGGLWLLPALAAVPVMETPARLERLPEPAGLARLVTSGTEPSKGLVLVLPDGLGEDGRAEPYVEALLARGIASLVLGLGEDPDAGPVDSAATPAAIAPALAWAAAEGFAPGRIGLLGFGLGGRSVLSGGVGLPSVAVYPGCGGLALPERGTALILQGGENAAGCEALQDRKGVMIHVLRGAGHGWDVPGSLWPSTGPLLPDPAGAGRLRATNDLHVTLEAAEAIADWLADFLVDPESPVP